MMSSASDADAGGGLGYGTDGEEVEVAKYIAAMLQL
jgi:hypothetical protein